MIEDDYFNWLYDSVCDSSYTRELSYYELFTYLYTTDFYWSIDKDENRAIDGVELRYIFAEEHGIPVNKIDSIFANKPCSVLEMMVGLAKRCEDHIACDYEYGDRTAQWFWTMLVNLGLGEYSDNKFNFEQVDKITHIFLDRKYKDNQIGCPFFVKNPRAPLRQTELWMQINWYLAEVL